MPQGGLVMDGSHLSPLSWGWSSPAERDKLSPWAGQSCPAASHQLQPLPGTWSLYLSALNRAWADLTASS